MVDELKIDLTKPLPLVVGLFILVATAGTTYLITDDDNAYLCEEREIVGLCFKISAENSDGFQTRCYYNSSAPTRYKTCSSGWIPYSNPDVTGKPIVIEDSVEDKIELVNGEFYIYSIKEKILLTKVNTTIDELKIELTKNINLINDNKSVYDYCMKNVCGKDYFKKGDIACPDECLIQQAEYTDTIQLKINKIKQDIEYYQKLQ